VDGSIMQVVLTWGAGGVLALLIMTGFLDPKRVGEQLRRDVDGWKQAFEKEQAAHEETREALRKETVRADAAIEQHKTTVALLERADAELARRAARRATREGSR